MVVTLFAGLTFQMFASAEIIGRVFVIHFVFFFLTLELGDVASGKCLIMINSNEPERRAQRLCELATLLLKVFLNVTKEAGPDNTQGCIFIGALFILFADKTPRLG